MTRIYVSGSTQECNQYAAGQGTEEQHMQAIAHLVAAMLWQNGFEAVSNRYNMTLQQIVADSDALMPDLHVAIHSNAGGGEGTEVFCWPGEPDTRSERMAKLLYEEVAPLSPGADRGVKDGRHLLEVWKPKATSALIEVEFHDNSAGALWIAGHHEDLAQAITRAICRFYKLDKGMTQTVTTLTLPSYQHRVGGQGYNVITALPEQLEVVLVNKIPTSRSGVNGTFFDKQLKPLGVVVADGRVIADRVMRVPPRPVFWISGDRAGISIVDDIRELGVVRHAIGGGPSLQPKIDIEKGKYQADIMGSVRERTAVGVTAEGHVKLVVTQPMTVSILAAVMGKEKCMTAMALDGGNSSTMVWDGKVIRGNQRAVPTAILIKEMI